MQVSTRKLRIKTRLDVEFVDELDISSNICLIADDAIRTRDIGLGRTTLYQLSYIRRKKTTLFQTLYRFRG